MKLSALLSISSTFGRNLGALLAAGVFLSLLAAACGSSPPLEVTPVSPPATASSTASPTMEPTAAPASIAATASSAAIPTIEPTAGPASTQATPPETPVTFIGSPAPDFPLKLFQGEEILGETELSLSDIAGQPIVLNFWARFCGPCWSEMPELQDFYEDRGDELRLLGVDIGQFTGLGSPKDAGRLLDALGVTYPAGYTDDASITAKYRIRAMPTTIFIDSRGVVFQSWTGAIDRQQLDRIIARMLERE